MSRSIVVAVVVSALFLFSVSVMANDKISGSFCGTVAYSCQWVFTMSGKTVFSGCDRSGKGTYMAEDGTVEIEMDAGEMEGDIVVGEYGKDDNGRVIWLKFTNWGEYSRCN
jgi:hypothetical protein